MKSVLKVTPSPDLCLLPELPFIPDSLAPPHPGTQGLGVTVRSCHCLPLRDRNPCPAPAWGPCRGTQSLRSRLLQRGSPTGSRVPPGATSTALQGLPTGSGPLSGIPCSGPGSCRGCRWVPSPSRTHPQFPAPSAPGHTELRAVQGCSGSVASSPGRAQRQERSSAEVSGKWRSAGKGRGLRAVCRARPSLRLGGAAVSRGSGALIGRSGEQPGPGAAGRAAVAQQRRHWRSVCAGPGAAAAAGAR